MATENNIPEKTASNMKGARIHKNRYIVGIGASAGGLEAINAFFESVPTDSGLSFVLIQHLSPDYKSMMPELLAKHTPLKINKVTDAATVEPNTIYTIPADKNITISGGNCTWKTGEAPKRLTYPLTSFLNAWPKTRKSEPLVSYYPVREVMLPWVLRPSSSTAGW